MTSSVSQASQISGVWDYAALIDDRDHTSPQDEIFTRDQARTQSRTTSAVHTRNEAKAKAQGQGQQGKGEKVHPDGDMAREMAFEDAESVPDMVLDRDSVFEHAL